MAKGFHVYLIKRLNEIIIGRALSRVTEQFDIIEVWVQRNGVIQA